MHMHKFPDCVSQRWRSKRQMILEAELATRKRQKKKKKEPSWCKSHFILKTVLSLKHNYFYIGWNNFYVLPSRDLILKNWFWKHVWRLIRESFHLRRGVNGENHWRRALRTGAKLLLCYLQEHKTLIPTAVATASKARVLPLTPGQEEIVAKANNNRPFDKLSGRASPHIRPGLQTVSQRAVLAPCTCTVASARVSGISKLYIHFRCGTAHAASSFLASELKYGARRGVARGAKSGGTSEARPHGVQPSTCPDWHGVPQQWNQRR